MKIDEILEFHLDGFYGMIPNIHWKSEKRKDLRDDIKQAILSDLLALEELQMEVGMSAPELEKLHEQNEENITRSEIFEEDMKRVYERNQVRKEIIEAISAYMEGHSE